MFMWYGMGFTLYVTKMPERFFPKRYCNVFQVFLFHLQTDYGVSTQTCHCFVDALQLYFLY